MVGLYSRVSEILIAQEMAAGDKNFLSRRLIAQILIDHVRTKRIMTKIAIIMADALGITKRLGLSATAAWAVETLRLVIVELQIADVRVQSRAVACDRFGKLQRLQTGSTPRGAH
jgi:hypothetical protein